MEVKDINNNLSNAFANPKANIAALVNGADFISLLNTQDVAVKNEGAAKFSSNAKKTASFSDNKSNNANSNSFKTGELKTNENHSKKAEKNIKSDSKDNSQKISAKDIKKEKAPVKTKSSFEEKVEVKDSAPTTPLAADTETPKPAETTEVVAAAAVVAPIANIENTVVSNEATLFDFDYTKGVSETPVADLTTATTTDEQVVVPLNNKGIASNEENVLIKEDIEKVLGNQLVQSPHIIKANSKVETSVLKNNPEIVENMEPEVDSNIPVSLVGSDSSKEKYVAENANSEELKLSDVARNSQIEKLKELLGSDEKIKVEVSVKEEKAFAVDLKSFSSNHLSLQEVNDKGTPEVIFDNSDIQQNTLQTKTPGIDMNNVVGFNNQVVQNIETPVIANKSEVSVANVSAEVSSNVASSSGEHIIVNAKHNLADTEKTSFRDIYRGTAKEVVDQIKINITKSAVKGIDKIDIQLKPEDLGRIEVKMQIGKDGKLQAHIISSKPEVMEILQRDVSSLEKAFKDAGFETNNQSFTFSFKEQENNQNKEQGLRNFLGNALESENDLLNQGFLPDSWDGKSALNIRV